MVYLGGRGWEGLEEAASVQERETVKETKTVVTFAESKWS